MGDTELSGFSDQRVLKSDEGKKKIVDSLQNVISTKTDDKSERPGRISRHTWERFQSLKARADNLTKKSTEKRIKHLQKQIIETVKEKLNTEEEKSILRDHNVDLDCATTSTSLTDTAQQSSSKEEAQKFASDEYKQQIQKYLGINDHLRAEGCGSKGPKSGLEREMEEAVARGDVQQAEELSDKLATRDFAVRISEAADAREFLKRKQEEEELAKSKKKKKLHWGFEHKQRWETKGNM